MRMGTFASFTDSVTQFVAAHGIYAVFGLMALDAVFPAASELVMLYGGALASGAFAGKQLGVFGTQVTTPAAAYLTIVLAGTIGYLVGSWLGWGAGRYLGRGFVERHAGAFHLGADRLARADDWFARRGHRAVFLGRLTPVMRSFVSVPAGFGQLRLLPYTLLTLAGSAVWCLAFAGIGWALGSSYLRFHRRFDLALIIAGVLLVVGVAGYFWRRRASRGL
jgi:membrane protein DedA with SNARE-associated domain